MIKLILGRIFQYIITLFCLGSVVFVLIRLKPGDPFLEDKAIPVHVKAMLEKNFGLDKSGPVQFINYWGNTLKGDLGPCLKIYQDYDVLDLIQLSFPISLFLGVLAMLYALLVGIPIGIIAALKKNSWIDYSSMVIAMLGVCVPAFVSGPIFQVCIAMNLPFVKVAGIEHLGDYIVPAIALGLIPAAYIARLTRGGMLEVLNLDYVRTAKAKGLPLGQIVFRHCLRGALMPVIGYLGPAFAAIITGSFVIESVFQIPGMGQFFIKGVTGNEIFIVQSLSLFYGVIIMAANLGSDLLQIWLNPQLRKDLVS